MKRGVGRRVDEASLVFPGVWIALSGSHISAHATAGKSLLGERTLAKDPQRSYPAITLARVRLNKTTK